MGRDGKRVKEKNEAGVTITDKSRQKHGDQELYRKWMKKTHLRIQKAGEVEDAATVSRARNARQERWKERQDRFSRGRGGSSSLGRGGRGPGGPGGRDMKGVDQVMKEKKQRVKSAMKRESRGEKARRSEEWKKGMMKKIQSKSRPTRSKMIIKGKKR